MSKIIKVIVTTEIEVPDNAELMRIKDEDGMEDEYIRIAGKLTKPGIIWMEYLSTARMKDEAKKRGEQASSLTGMGFAQIDNEFCEDNLKAYEMEKYYFEEKQ